MQFEQTRKQRLETAGERLDQQQFFSVGGDLALPATG
jgi:hypothetical protein